MRVLHDPCTPKSGGETPPDWYDDDRQWAEQMLDERMSWSPRRTGRAGQMWDLADRLSNEIGMHDLRLEYFHQTRDSDDPPMSWIRQHYPRAAVKLERLGRVVEKAIRYEREERQP